MRLASEEDVCEVLGVPRADAARVREDSLQEGRDWVRASRWMCLTDEGLQRLLKALGIPMKKAKAPEGEMTRDALMLQCAAEGEVLRMTLTVAPEHGRGMNQQLVLAEMPAAAVFPSDNGRVRVRVRSNDHFVAGMKLEPRWVEGDLWSYEGAMPRSRGRW